MKLNEAQIESVLNQAYMAGIRNDSEVKFDIWKKRIISRLDWLSKKNIGAKK